MPAVDSDAAVGGSFDRYSKFLAWTVEILL